MCFTWDARSRISFSVNKTQSVENIDGDDKRLTMHWMRLSIESDVLQHHSAEMIAQKGVKHNPFVTEAVGVLQREISILWK